MGGRGASSGISERGHKYGTQFHAVRDSDGKPMVYGNIKFVRLNEEAEDNDLLETMTRGRVYAVVGPDDKVKRIIYFDNDNRRSRQVDLSHSHKGMAPPHVHHGYLHVEAEPSKSGASRPTAEERRMVETVLRLWEDR